MRLLIKAIAAFGIVAASFLVTLWATNVMWPTCPSGTATALKPPFQKFGMPGFGWVGAAPEFDSIADSQDAPTRSNLLLCENNYILGPMHAHHAEIAKNGAGRYSHWRGAGFIFSASDNTNPNSNGRDYWVVRPR